MKTLRTLTTAALAVALALTGTTAALADEVASVDQPVGEPAPEQEAIAAEPTVIEPVITDEVVESPKVAAETIVATTIELAWILPDGGTPDNVTWPQPATTIATAPCGVFLQLDTYPFATRSDAARTNALDDDGVLTQGEDYGWAISWRFQYTGDCPPPLTPADPNPHANILASCGTATPWVSNDLEGEEERLTASFVVFVDGTFSEALVAVGGAVVQGTPVTFPEDSGDHVVTIRTGPAFGDVLLAEVTIDTNCLAPEYPGDRYTSVAGETVTDCDLRTSSYQVIYYVAIGTSVVDDEWVYGEPTEYDREDIPVTATDEQLAGCPVPPIECAEGQTLEDDVCVTPTSVVTSNPVDPGDLIVTGTEEAEALMRIAGFLTAGAAISFLVGALRRRGRVVL